MRNHEEVFEEIYRKEAWGKGKGSGTSSHPDYCLEYLKYLDAVIPDGSRVMDIGCGDHQLYANFDFSRWKYLGVDASETALELAAARYTEVYEMSKRPVLIKASTIPEIADLIIKFAPEFVLMKDVLSHWTDDEIDEYLKELTPLVHGPIIAAHSYQYFRKPEMNGRPRKLDRYSWAPIIEYHPLMMKYGFNGVRYYPRGRFKLILIRGGQ